MPGPTSVLDPNSPQMRALMLRSPNGVFAALASKMRSMSTPENNDLISGSNNAGGSMPVTPVNGTPGVQLNSTRYAPNWGGNTMVTRFNDAATGQSSFSISGGNETSPQSMFGGSPTSFAAGGMVTPQGGAVRPGAVMQPEPQLGVQGPDMNGQQLEQEAQKFVQMHPEEAQKVQAVIALAMQTGDLTTQELNMAVQLAKAALANPSAYPQIRQFAIRNGLGTEAEVPQQLDKGLCYALLVAGMSAQSVAPKGNAMQGQGPAPTMENGVMPSYKEGGMTGDKAHIAKVHAREYVIPEDALIYHGKKHFDKLVEQARTPPDAGQ